MIYLIDGTQNNSLLTTRYSLGNINDAVEYCATKKVLGVDTETEGFDFTSKKMIMLKMFVRNT